MSSRLHARVAALEACNRGLDGRAPFLACLHHEPETPEIVGAQSLHGPSVKRSASEPLEAFIARASVELRQWFMLALFKRDMENANDEIAN